LGHYVEWRAFIGPPWKPDTDAAHWDWSDLDAGSAYDPETDIPATSLDAAMTSGSTTAEVGSIADLPSAGTVWIGPNSSGESWERIDYEATGSGATIAAGTWHPVAGMITYPSATNAQTRLQTLTRETADNELTGAHAAGAAVRFWWPLDTADGVLSITEEMIESKDGTLATVTWAARL